MRTKTRATIENFSKVERQAELVNGEMVCMSPTGRRPGRASLDSVMSWRAYEPHPWQWLCMCKVTPML